MKGFVAGFVLATLAFSVSEMDQDAVELEPGDDVPFAGWLVSPSDFDRMLQATLDLPLKIDEIAAWERGHALAIQSMESAQEALKGCQPKRGVVDRALGAIVAVAPVALAWKVCSDSQ